MQYVEFLLVHSPLVGPATWRGVAATLLTWGHRVSVPDLREAAESGKPEAVVAAATRSAQAEPLAVAGHSGAGRFLPSIAAGLPARPQVLVFVDAGLPPCEGQASVDAAFLGQLRSLATDGILPRWSTWWGPSVMDALVPDAVLRAAVEEELPTIPLSLFESPLAVPEGWCGGPGAFLLLSESYRRDAAAAAARGWPIVERLGSHLDLVNEHSSTAEAILHLVRQSPPVHP